ncbi:MBL fold metallo-hydrolase [Luteimonas sp. A611]
MPSPDVHRFTIGALQAAVLRDGDITLPNDGSIVAMGEPKAEVDALLAAAGESTDPLRLAIQGLLVEAGERVVLFDTGVGAAEWADGGRLLPSLRAAGFEPAQVTDVFISHAHQDHVGGLVDGDGQPAFPNATVRLSEPEWAALRADEGQAALAQAIAPQVQAFAPGVQDVVPGVSAVPVDGHTPGHSAYLIGEGDARLLYIGDSAHHHVISVQRPRWTIQFDGDAPLAEDSREALLARAADEALPVSSPHFPFPGVGRIERRDHGFAWVPAP